MKIFHNGVEFASGGNRGRLGDVTTLNSAQMCRCGLARSMTSVYDKALSADEVKTLYGGTGDENGGKIIIETGGEDPTVKIFWGDNDGGDSATVDAADDAKWIMSHRCGTYK